MIEIQPGLTYLTRADWGARTDIPRLGHPVNRLDRTEAIMHHTVIVDQDATPNRWETLTEVKAKMVQLQTIRPDLGLDVPYNVVAFHMDNGALTLCEGRGFDRTGAHTHAHNTRGMATAGQGNFQTGQTIEAYADHWSRWWGYQKYDMGMENLGSSRPTDGPNAGAIAFGHRDFIATGCPGDNLYGIIPQLTFQAAPEPIEEDDTMLHVIQDSGTTLHITNYIYKRPLSSWSQLEELWALGKVERNIHKVSDALMAAIPNAGRRKAVSLGTTAAEVADELARRLAT
jgi:hypothetical protein